MRAYFNALEFRRLLIVKAISYPASGSSAGPAAVSQDSAIEQAALLGTHTSIAC